MQDCVDIPRQCSRTGFVCHCGLAFENECTVAGPVRGCGGGHQRVQLCAVQRGRVHAGVHGEQQAPVRHGRRRRRAQAPARPARGVHFAAFM